MTKNVPSWNSLSDTHILYVTVSVYTCTAKACLHEQGWSADMPVNWHDSSVKDLCWCWVKPSDWGTCTPTVLPADHPCSCRQVLTVTHGPQYYLLLVRINMQRAKIYHGNHVALYVLMAYYQHSRQKSEPMIFSYFMYCIVFFVIINTVMALVSHSKIIIIGPWHGYQWFTCCAYLYSKILVTFCL